LNEWIIGILMKMNNENVKWEIRVVENAGEMAAYEELQRVVWPASETDVVPAHVLISGVHNGGLLIGAYIGQRLVGFVFGIPGLYYTPDGPRPKHYSHILAVHPDFRNQGLGFVLKRAQWQMVRHQGIDRITWTYDPLLSTNARLNIAKLGAVCDTYLNEFYGEMRDGLNIGLPSDRFQVDWWVNTHRVFRRLSRRARGTLELEQYLTADAQIINPMALYSQDLPQPNPSLTTADYFNNIGSKVLLVEIPADFNILKTNDIDLALAWRLHTRDIFTKLFSAGFLVTDFVYVPGDTHRSYYVLSHGESTL
jgi:predicted GNAT superfamily acetyltransferase